ncbi:MAG: phage/plasmid primase, P4 family [Desulfovibrionaceae bacterium]
MSKDEIKRQVDEAVRTEQEQYQKSKEEQPSGTTTPTGYVDQLKVDYDDNHMGDARRFSERFGGKLIFDNTQGRWFRFQDTHWGEDMGRTHRHSLTHIAEDYRQQARFYGQKAQEMQGSDEYLALETKTAKREMLDPLLRQQSAWDRRAKELKDPGRIGKVLDLASVANPGYLGILGTEWNADPYLFACANAVIDLRTGKTLPANPFNYINRASGILWDKLQAESDLWETFLQQVFAEDQELIDYVQRCTGYWLTGLSNVQEFYCFWGPQGRNGKGVFFRTIRQIMGSYFQQIPPKFLLDEKALQSSDKPDQILVSLEHTRLACASEAPKRARFSEGAIKALSGGDPITCRGLYSNNITEYIPKFKMLFVTNRVPSVSGDDRAFQERLRIIKFGCTFRQGVDPDPEARVYPMDPQLEHKLHQPEHLSGILAWAVRGAVEFLKTMDLTPPASVLATTEDYMASNDFVGEFLEQCLEVTDATPTAATDWTRTQMKDIYQVFQRWCKEEKSIPESKIMSQNALGKDFTNRTELVKVPPKNKVFYNVVIRAEWQTEGKGHDLPY